MTKKEFNNYFSKKNIKNKINNVFKQDNYEQIKEIILYLRDH